MQTLNSNQNRMMSEQQSPYNRINIQQNHGSFQSPPLQSNKNYQNVQNMPNTQQFNSMKNIQNIQQQQTHHTTTHHSHIHKYQIPNKPQQQVIQQQQQQQQQQLHHTTTHVSHTHKYKLPTQPQPAKEIQQLVQVMNPKSPEINELYHVEREVQVLSIEEVEGPWKSKCVELEIIIFDLQTEIARYKNLAIGEKVNQVDDSQLKELEQKVNQLRQNESNLRIEIKNQAQEIDQWRTRYQKLQQEFQSKLGGGEEVRQLREQLSEKERIILRLENNLKNSNQEIENLIKELQNKDRDISNLRNHIQELESNLESYMRSEEQITYLSNEVDVWKKKFKDANKDFHDAQEKWMMAQAELDSIKNKQTIVTTEKQTVTQTHNTKTNKTGTNTYRQQH